MKDKDVKRIKKLISRLAAKHELALANNIPNGPYNAAYYDGLPKKKC